MTTGTGHLITVSSNGDVSFDIINERIKYETIKDDYKSMHGVSLTGNC